MIQGPFGVADDLATARRAARGGLGAGIDSGTGAAVGSSAWGPREDRRSGLGPGGSAKTAPGVGVRARVSTTGDRATDVAEGRDGRDGRAAIAR